MLEAQIVETTVAQPATKISLSGVTFNLQLPEYYAVVAGFYYDQEDRPIMPLSVVFAKEELSTWGDDDTVLLDLVKAKLGLQ